MKTHPQMQSERHLFHLADARAKSVLLVGDFTDWDHHSIRMHPHSDGVWTAAVPLDPGPHRYRFIVDGQWRNDPESKSRLRNPYGTEDDVC
jgi:1,4-alpha-glucan branching enzyme